MIFNMNGGGTKLFAAIGVTYPAGSTLTCTNGTKTFKAKTISGQWVFAIPEIGTWIVTATDPADSTKTKSQTVEITTEGQSVNVELSYWNGELYTVGNKYRDVTGGFVVANWNGGSSYYKADIVDSSTNSYLEAVFNQTSAGGLFTAKAIDITEFNTLTVVFDGASTIQDPEWKFRGYVAVANALGGNWKDPFASVFVASALANTAGNCVLDISGLTGSYYLGFAAFNAREGGTTVRATDIRLTK